MYVFRLLRDQRVPIIRDVRVVVHQVLVSAYTMGAGGVNVIGGGSCLRRTLLVQASGRVTLVSLSLSPPPSPSPLELVARTQTDGQIFFGARNLCVLVHLRRPRTCTSENERHRRCCRPSRAGD
jgi:hypothetical protein